MSKPKGGLGRGIGALIPSSPLNNTYTSTEPRESVSIPEETVAINTSQNGVVELEKKKEERKTGLTQVPITSIAPNPYQPRKHIDPTILGELADSIKEHGLIQPPVVSHNPNFDEAALSEPYDENNEELKLRRARYLLIAGERRWQASKLAGLAILPVVIKETTPLQMLELALVENIQRADLSPLEEAYAYRQLVSEFRLTQEEVAQKVGKSRAAVTNTLRLLDLSPIILGSLSKGEISEGHARALLGVRSDNDKPQLNLLNEIVIKGLSVRQTEEAVRRLNVTLSTQDAIKAATEAEKTSRVARLAERETRQIEQHLRDALKVKVELSRSKKGGKVTIHYSDDEELEEVFRIITGGYEI